MPAVNSNSKSGNIDGRVCAFAIQIFCTLCAYEISWFFHAWEGWFCKAPVWVKHIQFLMT